MRVSRIRLGTRGSRLARTQTEWVASALRAARPELEVDILTFTTTGDRMQERATKPEEATKGIFTREIEEALSAGEIDAAVHSCKDLGAVMPEGLVLAAVPVRERVADVLISEGYAEVADLPEDAVILTGSPRRVCQWREWFPGHDVRPVRGNVETRISKMREDEKAIGCVLAWAGLRRLQADLGGSHLIPLPVERMIPAPGQGALALQSREGDEAVMGILSAVDDERSRLAVEVERALLVELDAGCSVPLGALAEVVSDRIRMRAVYYHADGAAGCRMVDEADRQDWMAMVERVATGLREEAS